MHCLAIYVKEGLPFARDLSLENSADSYLRFQLALRHSVSYFFLLYRSTSLSLCTVFDFISSNIDEILSINQSVHVFVFGDFKIHYKVWLNYSGGTDRPGELCCSNFSVSNDLIQMVNFPTQIPDCNSNSPTLLHLFLFSDKYLFYNGFPSIQKFWCCYLNFHWLCDNCKTGCPVSWHSLWLFSSWLWWSLWSFERCLWEHIFKLSVSTAAIEFCEWLQVGGVVFCIWYRKIICQKLSSEH